MPWGASVANAQEAAFTIDGYNWLVPYSREVGQGALQVNLTFTEKPRNPLVLCRAFDAAGGIVGSGNGLVFGEGWATAEILTTSGDVASVKCQVR
ncbi:MAG: hypothetical protein OD811_06525 [Alphaproteobacteria bacterium]